MSENTRQHHGQHETVYYPHNQHYYDFSMTDDSHEFSAMHHQQQGYHNVPHSFQHHYGQHMDQYPGQGQQMHHHPGQGHYRGWEEY